MVVGIDDRKGEMKEQTEEQRALYSRAKRREFANPDRVGLNSKGQHTGSDSTNIIS
jgi:hypothetical protein